MIKGLLQFIRYGSQYTAIEHLGKNGDEHLRLLTGKLRQSEIFPNKPINISWPELTHSHANGIKHTHLIVNNHQVLSKKITSIESQSELEILNQAFPSLDTELFYYEIIRSDSDTLVYLCRKSYVQSLIDQYEELNISVTAWSFGITSTLAILPIFKNRKEVLSERYRIYHKNGQLQSIELDADAISEVYEVDDLTIDSQHLNLFGGVMGSAKGLESDILTNAKEDQGNLCSNYLQHRFYNLGLPTAIGVLLVIFLINFLSYNYYFQKVASLDQITVSNDFQKERLRIKQAEVNQKQKLFEDVIKSSASSSSYFTDKIIARLPETIVLGKLAYHPLSRKTRANKAIMLKTGIIAISGTTKINDDLSVWITQLEGLDFVSQVDIHKLEKQSNLSHFELEIKLKPS